MTDQEILQKAIEKAATNGWTMFGFFEKGSIRAKRFERWYLTDQDYTYGSNKSRRHHMMISYRGDNYSQYLQVPIETIIFSHAFAKAFFGEEGMFEDTEDSDWPPRNRFSQAYKGIPSWQYHLQQMVLEENPIQYLEKYL